MRPRCWLAQFSPYPCEGRLERAHLIPQQTIRREVLRLFRRRQRLAAELDVVWDPRCWAWACERHHHALDNSLKLRMSRSELPEGLEDYAREHGLLWYLDRRYGPLTRACA